MTGLWYTNSSVLSEYKLLMLTLPVHSSWMSVIQNQAFNGLCKSTSDEEDFVMIVNRV